MARNIPSLFSLTGTTLYNLGVRPTNLEQYNYPAQLVERYEDFARERAVLTIQRNERARRDAKAKIINMLIASRTRLRALWYPEPLPQQGLLENYFLNDQEGAIITNELTKLDIRDFMNQSFWWRLVRRGLERLSSFIVPIFITPQQAQGMNPHTLNSSRLIAIVIRFLNIEQYINAGIINPVTAERDIGVRYIRRNRNALRGVTVDENLAGIDGLEEGNVIFSFTNRQSGTWRRMIRMWESGIGRIGVIQTLPLQENQVLFGRRR